MVVVAVVVVAVAVVVRQERHTDEEHRGRHEHHHRRDRDRHVHRHRHPPSVWKIGKKDGNTWWKGIPRARIRVDTLPPRRISRPTSSTNYTGVAVGQRLELQAIRDTTGVEYELHRGNRELWNSGGTEGGTKEGGAEPVEEKIDLPPLGNV